MEQAVQVQGRNKWQISWELLFSNIVAGKVEAFFLFFFFGSVMSVVGKQHEQSKLLNCKRLLLLYFITGMVNVYCSWASFIVFCPDQVFTALRTGCKGLCPLCPSVLVRWEGLQDISHLAERREWKDWCRKIGHWSGCCSLSWRKLSSTGGHLGESSPVNGEETDTSRVSEMPWNR